MLARLTFLLALAGALLTVSLPCHADTASDIKALQSAVKTLQGQVSTLQTQNTSLQSQLNSVKSTLLFVSRKTDPTRTDGKKGTELYITGMNLHIINGLGATNGEPSNPKDTTNTTVNGLGNVIIGYNALRGNDNNGHSRDIRAGSHNLVVGDNQNYTSYGGIVFGADSTISGPYASVSGGIANTASGPYASVSGGYVNTASGDEASVSGGAVNTASAFAASVSGGYQRTASGLYDWVAGDLFQDY